MDWERAHELLKLTAMKTYDYILGIDPGTQTGLAIWDRQEKSFHTLVTCDILDAMELIRKSKSCWPDRLFVRIEDPTKRKWFGSTGRERLQGAGSVKRDFRILVALLKKLDIPYDAFEPKSNATKLDSGQFAKITGVTTRTSQHVRDAAMSVFGF